jgi:hypothetical protein
MQRREDYLHADLSEPFSLPDSILSTQLGSTGLRPPPFTISIA